MAQLVEVVPITRYYIILRAATTNIIMLLQIYNNLHLVKLDYNVLL